MMIHHQNRLELIEPINQPNIFFYVRKEKKTVFINFSSSTYIGRTGPGDSGLVHDILFDEDGPLAYHSAAHDAFGYLITHHKVGPGYNYLGASGEVLNPSRCMSGQISGLYFWKEILKTDKSDLKYAVA